VPDAGQVLFGAEDAAGRHAGERQVGFVFQHYALFRHMTVFENIAFGLCVVPRARRLPRAAIAERVTRLLELIQLGWLADRYPDQLSGGQRQRVALARALAIEPRVLLLDEPFGALDAKVRKELRRWLRGLHEEVKLTSVFVTHDQDEALELADRVVVMSAGRIEQIGAPGDVYTTPASAFVHEFLGDTNRLPCRVAAGLVRLPGGGLLGRADAPDGDAVAYVRPHDLDLAIAADGAAVIRHASTFGPLVRLVVALGESRLDVAMPVERWIRLGLAIDQRVTLAARFGAVFTHPARPAARLLPLVPGVAVAATGRSSDQPRRTLGHDL
jgi:sulfate transport system ATP-binding protein